MMGNLSVLAFQDSTSKTTCIIRPYPISLAFTGVFG